MISFRSVARYRQPLTKIATRTFASKDVPKTKEPVITAAPGPPLKNITLHSLHAKKRKGEKITMVTAYDFPSAVHVDKAGIDILLVGDSVGMVELGYETTLPVTMEQMLHHCKSVARGCHRPLLVADIPFGCFESDPKLAMHNAARLLKEGGMDSVKMEGGRKRMDVIRAVVDGGVAVFGHVGLTPQSFSALGGFKAQGKTADQAMNVLYDALAVQEAGCFATILECVPAVVAGEVSKRLDIPVIGIGSGAHCDGQVLVYHDLLGMMQHHHHAAFTPQFCKQYAKVGHEIQNALAEYRDDVKAKTFPDDSYSPYKIPEKETESFLESLEKFDAQQKVLSAGPSLKENREVDEDENFKLYG